MQLSPQRHRWVCSPHSQAPSPGLCWLPQSCLAWLLTVGTGMVPATVIPGLTARHREKQAGHAVELLRSEQAQGSLPHLGAQHPSWLPSLGFPTGWGPVATEKFLLEALLGLWPAGAADASGPEVRSSPASSRRAWLLTCPPQAAPSNTR